jgi:hypothetical protein
MIAFLLGTGFGMTVGAIASSELRALAYRLYNTAKIWLTKPPVE